MSNYEVMQFIQQKKAKRAKPKGQLATILYEVRYCVFYACQCLFLK